MRLLALEVFELRRWLTGLAVAGSGFFVGLTLARMAEGRSLAEAVVAIIALPVLILLPFRLDLMFPALVATTPFHSLLPGQLLGIPGLDLLNLVLLGSALGLLTFLLGSGERLRFDRRVLAPLAMAVLLAMIAIVRGRLRPGSPPRGDLLPFLLDYFIKPSLPLFLFVLGSNLRLKPSQVRTGVLALAVVIGATSLSYLLAVAVGSFAGLEARVLTGRLGTLSAHGSIVALMLPFLLFSWMEITRGTRRGVMLAATTAAGFALLFSYTRSAYLGAVLALGLMGLVRYRQLLWCGGALFLLAPLWLPSSVQDRILGIQATTEGLMTVSELSSGRTDIWSAALAFLSANSAPLHVGGGSGIFTQQASFFSNLGFWDVHNYFLETLMDRGLLGLAVYVWLLFRLYSLAWGSFRGAADPMLSGVGLACAASLTAGLSLSFFSAYNLLMPENSALWLFMGVLAAGRLHNAAPAAPAAS